jgi:hypothetical protein
MLLVAMVVQVVEVLDLVAEMLQIMIMHQVVQAAQAQY